MHFCTNIRVMEIMSTGEKLLFLPLYICTWNSVMQSQRYDRANESLMLEVETWVLYYNCFHMPVDVFTFSRSRPYICSMLYICLSVTFCNMLTSCSIFFLCSSNSSFLSETQLCFSRDPVLSLYVKWTRAA